MLRWKRLHSVITPSTRDEANFTVTGVKLTLPEIAKDLSIISAEDLYLRDEVQDGDNWHQDSPSQAFVTFVNGAPANQRGNSAITEDSVQCQPSTSNEMYSTRAILEHFNPFKYRFPVGNVRNRPSTSHELHRFRAKPEHCNPVTFRSPVDNVQNRGRTSHELHRTRANSEHSNTDLPAMNIHPQRSDEIYVKVQKPRETNRRVCRSQTALPVRNFTQKRSTLRAPLSRQSRSSAASLPPAPPPSTTPSKSANFNRSSTAPYSEGNTVGISLPPTVVEKTTGEDRPSASLALGGPGGDESCDSTRLDAQSDKDSSTLSKARTHSRHGSTSSINTDLSVHSKTSSAYFIENIYAQHERKKFGVRWDTDSLTSKAESGGNCSEGNESSIVNGAENTHTTDQTHPEVIPRPLTPLLSTIKETELVETVSRIVTDGDNVISQIQVQEEDTLNKNSNSLPDVTKTVVTRKPLPKKVKKERKPLKKSAQKPKILTPPASPSPTPSDRKLSIHAVISIVETEEKESSFDTELPPVVIPDIPLPSIHEGTPEPKLKIKNQMALPPTSNPKRSVRHRKASLKQSSYAEERMRLELAEKRRKKQQILLERLKMRTYPQPQEECTQIEKDSGPRFEDYDFLAKYCIFDRGSHHSFKEAFQSVDPDNPWLSGQQVIRALKSLNTKLSEVEDEYLRRILELMGYDVSTGADFKLFSVIAALSKRISALDDWMKDLIGKIDFASLEMKMDLWKALWECSVDTESNTVSLDQLCVELQAGGISREHQFDVRRKLGHLTSLDLLDFLSYIPLFVIIHESVVKNPFSNRREK
ncbi:uncharacterized protein LOC135481447 isoform X3 [Liolophura sinensis]|uniref:uncharacterized protein LOC135481447 isoform X3 n=1 Tax=Liolophura sinensis TaxID=3198878 RepID=UPI003158FCF4